MGRQGCFSGFPLNDELNNRTSRREEMGFITVELTEMRPYTQHRYPLWTQMSGWAFGFRLNNARDSRYEVLRKHRFLRDLADVHAIRLSHYLTASSFNHPCPEKPSLANRRNREEN